MRTRIAGLALLSTLLLGHGSATLAHGPTPQKIAQSVDIKAPPDQVWAAIQDFGGISRWNPALSASKADKGNEPGSTRTLTFRKGGDMTEGLDAYDAATHSYSYRMGDENLQALPLSSYSATISVVAGEAPGSSRIEWVARGYRGDTSNEPPEELSDTAAVDALSAYMRGGLDAIKKQLESR